MATYIEGYSRVLLLLFCLDRDDFGKQLLIEKLEMVKTPKRLLLIVAAKTFSFKNVTVLIDDRKQSHHNKLSHQSANRS